MNVEQDQRGFAAVATEGLDRALTDERRQARQALALGGLIAILIAIRLSALRDPLMSIVILVAAAALIVELAWTRMNQGDATFFADELILAGQNGTGRRTPVDNAVEARIASITAPRSRHRLAEDLRRRVRLAAAPTRTAPSDTRRHQIPPIGVAERQVFLDEGPLALAVADRIDQAPTDPRALVILHRLVASPPTLGRGSERPSSDELRDALRHARSLIETADSAGMHHAADGMVM
jgi:hypothetical protein